TITAAPGDTAPATTTTVDATTTIAGTTTTELDPTDTTAPVTFAPATVPLPTLPLPATTTTSPGSTTSIPAGATGRYLSDPSANVKLGDWGPAVDLIQRQLVIWHFGTGVTFGGVYDAATKADVAAFQRGQGLAADGICGKNTWAILSTDPPP